MEIRDNRKGGALTETTFLVLLAAYQPNHGYGMMQFIEKATRGRVCLGAGTLYGAVDALLRKKWIAPLGEGSDGRKKEYQITELGKQKAREEYRRLGEVLKTASGIMGEEESQ